MEATLKRIYVGGITPLITKAELEDRFGKFGKVDDVEIVYRKDEEGNPIKTFAYLNLNISDVDLKKCMSLLNKTKWKGGTLQIEIAKESFLHRLSQERQKAEDKRAKAQRSSQVDLVKSLENAGVKDFHMKSAVPGTQVPNHKNWVVSKFGRVLPVVHLNEKKQSKIMKYDPSKYCHNLKKIDDTFETVSVSQLTWQLEGGDDDISRKRRGEFPSFTPPAKKKLLNLPVSYDNNTHTEKRTPLLSVKPAATKTPLHSNTPRNLPNRRIDSMNDEYDSEEELQALLRRERERRPIPVHAEDSNVEVVDDTFELSYTTHWAGKRAATELSSTHDDREYDSVDTDEIITGAKTVHKSSHDVDTKSETVRQDKSRLKVQKNKEGFTRGPGTKGKPKEVEMSTSESDNESGTLDDDSSDYSDEEYTAMMQNCVRLDVTMGDLEALAKEAGGFNDEEEDDEDTDEIITGAKTVHKSSDDVDTKSETVRQEKCKLKAQKSKEGFTPGTKGKSKEVEKSKLESNNESGTSDDDSSDYSDEEYTAMMQNCVRLDVTMGDLETLAKEADGFNDDDEEDDDDEDDDDEDTDDTENEGEYNTDEMHAKHSSSANSQASGSKILPNAKKKEPSAGIKKIVNLADTQSSVLFSDSESSSDESDNGESIDKDCSRANGKTELIKPKSSTALQPQVEKERKTAKAEENKSKEFPKKRGLEPEDIVASILKDDRDDDLHSNLKKSKGPPAFKGLGSLLASTSTVNSPSSSTLSNVNTKVKDDSVSNANERSKKNDTQEPSIGLKQSSSGSSEEESDVSSTSPSPPKPATPRNGTTKEKATSVVKQQQDNQKRLVAMMERSKERELQKQIIQGALLKLDTQSSNKKHIVFNSESENEEEDDDAGAVEEQVIPDSKKTNERPSNLFESSEEDSDNEEEKDDGRFEIKAQYEGRSGMKLMQLQTRFGTDDRFKMDSRFLESSSEDEESSEAPKSKPEDDLSTEKRKNLDILQSILSVNVEPQSANKETTKGKKFKDLNALHYDPTKEDHATFETKVEQKKESKAQRAKKRLEAEKLPDVSKETYHEVIMDFRDVFGAPKTENTNEPETTWDQEAEPETVEAEEPTSNELFSFQNKKTEEPVGFTFSFFETSAEESTPDNEPYKIETIKPAKVAWQEDPRFQDSSSEDDDEKDQPADTENKMSTRPDTSTIQFFFFVKDDERLKSGPKMFFRSSKTEQREGAWEQRQGILLEECRKRHKDAKRKLKSKD